MNFNDFFDAVKVGETGTLYLMEGAEEYIKEQAIVRLRGKLLSQDMEAMNYSELNNPAVDELIAAVETIPLLSDMRVVLVKDCDLLTAGEKGGEEKLEQLLNYLEKRSPSTCLVFSVKGRADGRKKLYQALKKKNAIVDFSPMGDVEAARWAMRTMRSMGKQMSLTTAQKLVFTVGRDASLLRQEMEKLFAYAGEQDMIADEDIDAICVRTLECTVFQMVDAQASGRTHDACRLLNTVLEGGEDRFMVLSMLLRQYRILYHARCLLEERAPASALPALLGIPPFAVARTQSQAKLHSKETLKAAYDDLYDLEYSLKSGRISQEGSAEAALFRLDFILGTNASREVQ
ncbi:MAG: DNA polymerase III subunit delta [Eubacteriales bacterium]|nr:DNA polymerase III subunit delta [Eubacteriales bacterium]